jgi:D-alanyl-D-alanine carboxypeptidase/D-alanyl-D-alanine-endopeptidase (penicillin-binding protein 4)
MRRTKAENNFHGKTGTLNGVTSLSGYLTTNDGEELVVSMIFQFSRGGTRFHRRIEDKIVEALTSLQ